MGHSHPHHHDVMDPVLFSHERGVWAVKWSLAGLFVTAFLQLGMALWSGSAGLLADTIHNFGDAATAIPLWIAFRLSARPPTQRFTYGYSRFEDFAGLGVLLAIFLSALGAGAISLHRFFHPHAVSHWEAVCVASVIGFLGNEGVARLRIKVGREIGSASLTADGYHARTDAWTSLAVLGGALGVRWGFPLADSLVGLGITAAIFLTCYSAARDVLMRFLDAVDPGITREIRETIQKVPDVRDVTEIRVRWLGHRLHVEANIAVESFLPVEKAHHIAQHVNDQLRRQLKYISGATIHVDPLSASGEAHHSVHAHP